jgi:glycosyltransferase involved in cell wall biosynthesis
MNRSRSGRFTPLVSVVVPAYNEAGFLTHTLQSLRAQDYPNLELIVVDNSSEDATAAVAREHGVQVIHEPRRGVAYARQRGFEAAQGTIVATTDADTVVPHDWVSRIVAQFEKDESLVAFGGLYRLHSGPITARMLVLPKLMHKLWRWDRYVTGGWRLAGANMAVRADAFHAVGGFDTSRQLGEDDELSIRLRQAGTVLLDPTLIVSTSGRRYRRGMARGLATYLPHVILESWLQTGTFNRLPTVREEHVSLRSRLAFWAGMIVILLALPFHATLQARIVRAEDYSELKLNAGRAYAVQYVNRSKDSAHAVLDRLPELPSR